MQPKFPRDHHFHSRRRPARGDDPGTEDLSALADQALRFLARHCLPAFDASDPRATA